jgi:hypothetical protein
MIKRNLALVTVVGVIAVAAMIFTIPAMASTFAAPQNAAFQQQPSLQHSRIQKVQLSVGQSITLSSLVGGFRKVGDQSVNGTANGSLSFSVTGVYARGYTLSVTGGSITFNGATYTMSGGSAELGPYGARIVGQGDAGSAQILFAARSLGRFGNTGYGIVGIDLKSGSNEFMIRLLVTISK